METVLHYEQIEASERLAQPLLIGKAGQRIGGNHPQCLDAARYDGVDDVGIGQAALFRQSFRVQPPQRRQFLAVCPAFKLAVARQR